MDTGRVFKEILVPAFGETMYMVLLGTFFAVILGSIFAVSLVITADDGLHPNRVVYRVLDGIVNILRAFPFVILAIAIMPVTRIVMGTIVGKKAALLPLVMVAAPFVGRIIESDLKSVDSGIIEAAKSFGASTFQIIFRIMFVEALPSICLSVTTVTIEILGGSAIAGALGAGGLGAVAMIYGYQSFNDTVMYGTVLIMVILVSLIQFAGTRLYKKLK